VKPPAATAVLHSGGLDSAVLLALELRERGPALPIHVRSGLAWEDEEARAIARLLASPPYAGGVLPPVTLTVDMREVYPTSHWAVTGRPPAFDTPDEDVYLAGRNVILLSKAAVLCAQRNIGAIALGPLAGNPFPDATPAFFASMADALSLGLGRALEIRTPLVQMEKDAVIRLGLELGVPLALTLSCMNPSDGAHCGRCSKCRERRDAFRAAGVEDGTVYAVRPER
jgi:7-cyano-7-deazaguanine synthase